MMTLRRLLMETVNIKLIDVFDGKYPDEHALIWNYIGTNDFDNKTFPVETVSLKSVLPEKAEVSFVTNYSRFAEPWQKRLVKTYRKNIAQTKEKPIIMHGQIVVDGNHKLMAMLDAKEPFIKVIRI